MSGFHLAFPREERPQLTVARASIAHVRMEAWSLTSLILVCAGVMWSNLAWLTGLWQLSVFLFAACAALSTPKSVKLPGRTALYLSYGIPIVGAAQMLFGLAAYNYVTLQACLAWGVFPAFLLLGIVLLREHRIRDLFLSSLWFFSLSVTIMELYQLLVLGRFNVLPSGYPLMSPNLYAEMAELLLPVVLATAIRKGGHLWAGCGLVALMIGTTVCTGARVGTALLLAETILVFWASQRMTGYRTLAVRKHGLALGVLVTLALALEGTAGLTDKIVKQDSLAGRPEIVYSTVLMVKQHPIVGFGLGSFSTVYPAFDRLNSGYTINHAHNDYMEIAAETGAIGLLLWLATLAACIPSVIKTPWAFGVVAILIHSFMDFPLFRLPVVALMALLTAAAIVRAASAPQPERTPNVLMLNSRFGKRR